MIAGLLTIATLVMLLQACGTYSTSSITPAPNAPDAATLTHKVPDLILVTEKDILDKKYTSLGDISVSVRQASIFADDPTRDDAKKALQERAADMGADAVILVHYGLVEVTLTSWGALDAHGRAVVFQ